MCYGVEEQRDSSINYSIQQPDFKNFKDIFLPYKFS